MRTSPPVVLVVHPDAQARMSLYTLLAGEGHLVATASRGLEALEYVFKRRPGVVVASPRLTDIGLKTFLHELGRAGLGACTVLLDDSREGEDRTSEVAAAVDRCLHEACL